MKQTYFFVRLSTELVRCVVVLTGGHFTKLSVRGVQHEMTKWTQRDLRFCKNERFKRSKNCKKKKGVNKIENYVENWYKWSNDRFL